MKKLLLIMGCVALSFIGSAQEEAIINGGFEEPLSVGWKGNWGKIELITDSYDGQSACKMVVSKDGWENGIKQTVLLKGLKTYILSFAAKSSKNSDTTLVYLTLKDKDTFDITDGQKNYIIKVAGADYKMYSIEVPTTETTATAELWASSSYGTTDNTLIIDNVSLKIKSNVGVITNLLSDIQIFPNPTTDILKIEFTGNTGNFDLINITGQIVKSAKLVSGLNELTVAGQPKGIYIAKVSTTGGSIISKKLVIK